VHTPVIHSRRCQKVSYYNKSLFSLLIDSFRASGRHRHHSHKGIAKTLILIHTQEIRTDPIGMHRVQLFSTPRSLNNTEQSGLQILKRTTHWQGSMGQGPKKYTGVYSMGPGQGQRQGSIGEIGMGLGQQHSYFIPSIRS